MGAGRMRPAPCQRLSCLLRRSGGLGFRLGVVACWLRHRHPALTLAAVLPLQLFFADLHSEVPLQEFTPVQCTVAASAANVAVLIPEVNNIAAAAAIAALDSLLICIFDSSIVFQRSDIAALVQDPANGVIITQLSKLMSSTAGGQEK